MSNNTVVDFCRSTKSNFLTINQSISVSFEYEVCFTNGIFELENSLLANVIGGNEQVLPRKVIAVVDSGLLEFWNELIKQLKVYSQHYSDVFTLVAEPMIVPGGEDAKNDINLLGKIHQVIDDVGLCRHSYLLAIGGGAVLDLVGYAAATAHRGIRLIRIPTTVLAQNDSGVGVKNGINAFGKKNFLGTFATPYAVLNDFDFLHTLDNRDWRSGIAEAVKVALIKDAKFFEFLEENTKALANRDMKAMQQVIYRCAQLHLEHIAKGGDPFEMGSSRPLDFGHWAAHKLENLTNYNLRHGEAVAIGIALDSTYSYLLGTLPQVQWKRIIKTLKALGFDLYVPELSEELEELKNSRCIFKGLLEFQEHIGGELQLILLQNIGQGIEINKLDLSLYRKAIFLLANQ
ncbi:MAG: 3-dehydroquinate synthase [Scytonematopsis contorta HA4267-MV1]|jgi:3-dehydroquinate synthase|nr:3-dehydroquinate synthase [Scytonematopsis contorta HA4267-MV1]